MTSFVPQKPQSSYKQTIIIIIIIISLSLLLLLL